MNSHKVSIKQLAIISFILSVSFKVVMLPQYLSSYTGTSSYVTIMLAMGIEMFMFALIYKTISVNTVTRLDLPNYVIIPVLLALSFSQGAKLLTLSTSTVSYISSVLFDQGLTNFIVLTLLPVIAYISYSGGNNIGRIANVVLWFIIFSILFYVFFARARVNFYYLFPVLPENLSAGAYAYDKYIMWFGDFTPLLFLSISEKDANKKGTRTIVIAMLATYFIAVIFYVLFVVLFGNAGYMVSNAFSKMAVYNKISNLVGSIDFPIVCTWIMMAIIKLASLFYVLVQSFTHLFKKRGIVTISLTVILALLLRYAVNNLSAAHAFATGALRYIVGGIDFAVPIALFATVKLRARERRKYNEKTAKE